MRLGSVAWLSAFREALERGAKHAEAELAADGISGSENWRVWFILDGDKPECRCGGEASSYLAGASSLKITFACRKCGLWAEHSETFKVRRPPADT